ncbi:MAG TPA: phosphoribosylaminoimidazolesuccinocarboxamide synthase [Candidatus Paceibacterota bacterium]|nr:phosphoribosylaminoimidazolesuccinocarboxamide synthase [Candidatus Paceibacterota bacterium]
MPNVVEGKTKKVIPIRAARFVSKDDLTAGDGKKHDILPGKGELATRTTVHVFELLRHCGLPVAYIAQDSPTSFIGYECTMVPLEVVVRREAHGSFLKRSLAHTKGDRFETPKVEFYLKTKGRRFREHDLPCDDPYMVIVRDEVRLYRPDETIVPEAPFLTVRYVDVFGEFENDYNLWSPDDLAGEAVRAFLILETAWQKLERRLVDFKLEFGVLDDGTSDPPTLIADVIDNDSWRLMQGDDYVDKQVYRDGGDLEKVLKNYRRVADMTGRFRTLRESIRTATMDAIVRPTYEPCYRT